MLSTRYRPWHVPIFLAKYAWLRTLRRPVLLNFEVTMRCNARCGFCDYWQTPASEKAREWADFAAIARRFSPMLVTFTGGEPTLRRDLEDIVRAVRGAVRYTYVQMITHGAMLSLDRAMALWDAGVDQFNISLDYLDGRHDDARGIPGLTARLLTLVPAMQHGHQERQSRPDPAHCPHGGLAWRRCEFLGLYRAEERQYGARAAADRSGRPAGGH
jgi:hypothetical protein